MLELNDIMEVKKGYVWIGLLLMIGLGFFLRVFGDFCENYLNIIF